MAQVLDFLVINTYNTLTMGIADISTYTDDPPDVSSPSLNVCIPGGFPEVDIPFVPEDFNVLNSLILEITAADEDLVPIPDGVYTLTYSVAPSFEDGNSVTHTFMRTDKFQQKFDEAFMKLDMMECDKAIKKQAFVDLNSIYFFIQGAIAAANNCAVQEANKLYNQANRMLDQFIKNNCGCSGTNYVVNYSNY